MTRILAVCLAAALGLAPAVVHADDYFEKNFERFEKVISDGGIGGLASTVYTKTGAPRYRVFSFVLKEIKGAWKVVYLHELPAWNAKKKR